MRSKYLALARPWLAALIAIFLAALLAARPAHAAEPPRLPFTPGEKLHFILKWGPIYVGDAWFEVAQDTLPGGGPGYRLTATIKSSEWADRIYKVRDFAQSWVDPGMTRSHRFTMRQREGGYRKKVELSFDPDGRTARRVSNDKVRPPLAIPFGSHDPLSVFFALRMHDPDKTKKVELPVTDGDKLIMGEGLLLGRETIEIDSGTYETWQVEPKLEGIGGIFKKSPGARMFVWVSADERRIPVMVKSSLILGSFTAELAEDMTGKTQPSPAPDSGQTQPETN